MGISNIGGGVFGAIGAYQQSVQAEEDAKFNKRIAKFNAAMARNQATEAMQNEDYTASLRTRDSQIATLNAGIATAQAERVGQDVRVQSTAVGKSIRAHAAGAGLSADEGSPLLARLTSARLGEYDATVAEFGYRMSAFKSDDDAKMLLNEAAVHAQRAQYLKDYGIAASGALLDAQAKFYQNWETYQGESRFGQVVMGAVAGFLGSSYQAPKASQPQGVQPYAYDRTMNADDRASVPSNYGTGTASNYGHPTGHYGQEFADVSESGSGAFRISEGAGAGGAY